VSRGIDHGEWFVEVEPIEEVKQPRVTRGCRDVEVSKTADVVGSASKNGLKCSHRKPRVNDGRQPHKMRSVDDSAVVQTT
jgi:hypothetical protein